MPRGFKKTTTEQKLEWLIERSEDWEHLPLSLTVADIINPYSSANPYAISSERLLRKIGRQMFKEGLCGNPVYSHHVFELIQDARLYWRKLALKHSSKITNQ